MILDKSYSSDHHRAPHTVVVPVNYGLSRKQQAVFIRKVLLKALKAIFKPFSPGHFRDTHNINSLVIRSLSWDNRDKKCPEIGTKSVPILQGYHIDLQRLTNQLSRKCPDILEVKALLINYLTEFVLNRDGTKHVFGLKSRKTALNAL